MPEQNSDLFAQLERLAEFRKKGTLTEEEFQTMKSKILKKLSSQISDEKQGEQIEIGRLTSTTNNNINLNEESSEFQIYENSTYGIKIQYPSDWEGTELNRYIGNGFTRIVEFGIPFEKPSRYYGRYKQMLAIDFRGSYSTSLPLDIYIRQRIFLLKRKLKDIELAESAQTMLSNRPAYKLVFRYRHSDSSAPLKLENMRIWTVSDTAIYQIVYAAPKNEFSYGLSTIEKMINSFQITENAISESSEAVRKNNDLITYENKALGTNIDYPKDWIVDEMNLGQSFNVEFLSPSENNCEDYEVRLVMEVRNIRSGITLDGYTHNYINQLTKKTPKSLKFTLLECISIAVSDNPAKRIIYTTSTVENEVKTMEIVVIKDDKIYTMTFGAELPNYVHYLPTIQKILESFSLG